MKLLLSLRAMIAAFATSSTFAADAGKPNIVVILSDDFGYGSLGCYGADPKLIQTPNHFEVGRLLFAKHTSRRFTKRQWQLIVNLLFYKIG